MKKRMMAFVLVIALLGGFAGSFSPPSTVSAQSLCTSRTLVCLVEIVTSAQSRQEFEAIWGTFTRAEQQSVLEVMQPARTETRVTTEKRYETADLDGRAKTCSSVTLEVVTLNIWDNKVASFFQQVNWCWNNKKIKPEVSYNSWGHIWVWLYDFLGTTGSYTTGGVGYPDYYVWSQGKFGQCPPVIGCTITWYMEASQRVFKDGTHNP